MAIAKNNKFTGVKDLDGEAVKKVINEATLSEKKKSNAGRKKKLQVDKSTKTMVVYFTEDQKETMENYCSKKDIPFSVLVRQLLNEKGIL